MRPLFQKYTMQKMNKDICHMIKEDKVNNLKLFVASDEAKLSVTLKADDNYNNQYHGLHPKFDDKKLLSFLSNNSINDLDSFWGAIKTEQELNNYMNLIINNDIKIGEVAITSRIKSNLEETLLERAILQMASHFGFRFKVDPVIIKELQSNLIDIWCKHADGFTKLEIKQDNYNIIKTMYWQINIQECYIDLLGIWPFEVIKGLEEQYQINVDDPQLPKIVCKNSSGNIKISEFLSFNSKYLHYFRLRTSSVYYSGVMPRVMKIEYDDSPTSSNNVKYLVFHVVRTTFATVDFMDNPSIIKHPFFYNKKMANTRYKLMIDFDLHEDLIQEKYLYSDSSDSCDCFSQREYEKAEINKINKYLQYSFNTHTIAVSANIETKDNYLLMGKRGNIAIDSGEYYCSANGQTEFRDEFVSFYHSSVFEDLPSMDYNSKYRIDLNNEVQRETIAELGISTFKNEWKYYGVSYLSIHNNGKDNLDVSTPNVLARRMHFNVLTSNSTYLCFKDVLESYEHATENFENSIIKGLRTVIFKDEVDRRKKILLSLYEWFYRNKSNVFLIMFFIAVILNKNNDKMLDINNMIDIILLITYIIIILSKWIRNKTIRDKRTNIYLLLTKYLNEDGSFRTSLLINDISSKIKKDKEKEKLHAIFKVMYILYFLDNK